MGGGGTIIIGDEPLNEILRAHQHQVAAFRLELMLKILDKYDKSGFIDQNEQAFILRCANDLVDNQ